MSRSGKASAFAALAASAAAGWGRLHARERRLVLLAAAVVLGALLWQLALAPAVRTLRQAEGERAALQARWQQMQLLKSEAEALQAMPRLVFPGGALIGDAAGFLNAARGKGVHSAILSGMLAADACSAALRAGRAGDVLSAYPQAFCRSWLHDELWATRNFKPWLTKAGLYFGSTLFAAEQKLFAGNVPWTLRVSVLDHVALRSAAAFSPIAYPPADGVLTFDRPSSVFLANLRYEKDQPVHLHLKDERLPVSVNLAKYDAPEQRYCPAGVYRVLHEGPERAPRLQIDAQNCLHCRTCDIKDPLQNIEWTPPQGGDGPAYTSL